MSATSTISAIPATWTAANPGGNTEYVLLQLRGQGPVVVQVAASAPANDSQDGIVIDDNVLRELPLPGLGATDIVYVRSLDTRNHAITVYSVPTAV